MGVNFFALFVTLTISFSNGARVINFVPTTTSSARSSQVAVDLPLTTRDFFIGPCLVKTNNTCPDDEVTFFLYTRKNMNDSQQINISKFGSSNIRQTDFNANNPTKIIIHGYNSDMFLDTLVSIRTEYLTRGEYNAIAVDWHRLAVAPCYPVAVHNVPHVGNCVAQLIDIIKKETGAKDIHVIGFSLGAHVPAFSARALRPYKIPRITGLDPAMPLFITVSKDEKLDSEDADFVDVFHTNAFIQGKVEASGHIDFYMNGGINQPGCWEKRNPFGCNHHRAAVYFAESINSDIGFWGWPCPGLLSYLLGLCPPRFPAVLAGDRCNFQYRGFHLVKTRAEEPFAQGPFTENPRDTHK
ncbi:lipase member H [Athalia rosae]|uniref:lipase member H n=1 Tax=Athalia rosae TaxID=37344 RepID=UPI002033952F|nr:lipase member H [Athalia rosae]